MLCLSQRTTQKHFIAKYIFKKEKEPFFFFFIIFLTESYSLDHGVKIKKKYILVYG